MNTNMCIKIQASWSGFHFRSDHRQHEQTWRQCLSTIGRNRWVSHTLKGNFCFQATGNYTDLCSCKGICEKPDKYPQETCFSAPPPSLWDLLYFSHFCAFGCFLSNSKRHPLTKKSNRLRTLCFCFLACAAAAERVLFLSTFCTRLRSEKQWSRKQESVGNFPISFTSLNIPCLGQYHLQFN